MPPWITSLLALLLLVAFGAYMVYEGFESSPTSELSCKQTYEACRRACSSSNAACFTTCSKTYTACLSNAVAAATVVNTGPLNRPYTTANMKWAASTAPEAQGRGSNNSSNGYFTWMNSAGSSTSFSVYNTDLSRSYRGVSGSWSNDPTWSNDFVRSWPSKSPSSSSSKSPATTTLATPTSSAWDANKGTYTSGWPQQTFNLENDGSYDSSIPLEGSYIIQVKKWKPHEIPTQDAPGVTVTAPTDEGTDAEEIRTSTYTSSLLDQVRGDGEELPASLQQLIRADVQDTMDGIFRNQYEIQYT
jgi:hypothetical protein